MASEKDSCQSYCADDPNFAIICSFLERFAHSCGVSYPTFSELQEMIESPQDGKWNGLGQILFFNLSRLLWD